MKRSKRALLAVGLIAGAAAMTGCTAKTAPEATKAPAAQQQTAQPQTTEPVTGATASPDAGGEEAPAPLALSVLGKETEPGALEEGGRLYLPLEATGEALGWAAKSESDEEETAVRRTVTLEKEESRITVSWVSSDNTTRQITWQKDGLLIPVDTRIRTMDGVVYVPAAFFEEAADAVVTRGAGGVNVILREPEATPETSGGQADEDAAQRGNKTEDETAG
ncbi:MAG: hypothetical protein J6M47_09795 [Clostridia bacterium]|nr:hypothetical protein [Clostridia bacterium]